MKEINVDESIDMNMCVSFSMFQPKNHTRGHRTWDDYYTLDRYWYNIPALVSIYKTMYPTIDIIIHISINLINHPIYKMLILLNDSNLIKLVIHNEPYFDMEPTLWRYTELFDESIDVLFVRDLDSIPNVCELLSNNHFINSNKLVSSIRSHSNHNCLGTIMLAGLSSFKPSLVDNRDLTYDKFINGINNKRWGVDQKAIITYVFNHLSLQKQFIDYMNQGDSHEVRVPINVEYESINVNTIPNTFKTNHIMCNMIDSITKWSGQPVDVRNKPLYDIINDCSIRDELIEIMIESNVCNFYGVDFL